MICHQGFRVGSNNTVSGLFVEGWDLGFRVWDLGFRVQGFKETAQSFRT